MLPPFLEEGIRLNDFDASLNTQDGRDFMEANHVFVGAHENSAVYAPAGWVTHVLYTVMCPAPRKFKLEVALVVVYTFVLRQALREDRSGVEASLGDVELRSLQDQEGERHVG